jgi:hypothetical protein
MENQNTKEENPESEIIPITVAGHTDDIIKDELSKATPNFRKHKGQILEDANVAIFPRITNEMKEEIVALYLQARSAQLLGRRIANGQRLFLDAASAPSFEFFAEVAGTAQLELWNKETIPFRCADKDDMLSFSERLLDRSQRAKHALEELVETIKKSSIRFANMLTGGKVVGDLIDEN